MTQGRGASLPENLTNCGCCGLPFPEPITNWDEFFVEIEDAEFYCARCAEAEGIEVADVG